MLCTAQPAPVFALLSGESKQAPGLAAAAGPRTLGAAGGVLLQSAEVFSSCVSLTWMLVAKRRMKACDGTEAILLGKDARLLLL